MSGFAWWHYTLSFSCSLRVQWLWYSFNVTAESNSFNWKFYVLDRLSWNFAGVLCTPSRSWIYHYLPLLYHYDFRTYWREIIDAFEIWQKLYCWHFHGRCSGEVFQIWIKINLPWSLPIYAKLDDLDLVSRSQVCQNKKNANSFSRFLSTVD